MTEKRIDAKNRVEASAPSFHCDNFFVRKKIDHGKVDSREWACACKCTTISQRVLVKRRQESNNNKLLLLFGKLECFRTQGVGFSESNLGNGKRKRVAQA